MESVIYFCVLMLFFTFVYGYSQYFHEKHRNDPKKLYIPMEGGDIYKNINVTNDNINMNSINNSINDNGINDNVISGNGGNGNGRNGNSKNICDPDAIYKKNGDNSKFCLNGGSCIESGSNTGIYNCSCVKPYIGDNCWSKGAVNQGVKVDITDNFTSPTEIVRITMNKRDGYNYFIQDNNYL